MPSAIDMETMGRILKAASAASLVSLALLLAPVTGASAGNYHVYACGTPAGESAPTDGWSPSVKGAYDNYAKDTCAAGGALTAALGDLTAHIADLDQATWTFSTPASDSLVGATLWRAGDADGGEVVNATYEFWLAGPTGTQPIDSCAYQFGCTAGAGDFAQPLAQANRVVVPSAHLGAHVYLNAACEGNPGFECPSGTGDSNGYAAVVNLYAADLVLEQGVGPTATNVGGELASAPAVSGMTDVTFSASDPGAGVWETTFSLDGKLVQSTVPNENGGRCRNVGQTADGTAAFLYLQPCPQSESVDLPFNTTAVSNGLHHLVVTIVDPAGNTAPVIDREIDVKNPVPAPPPQPNGTNASTGARLTARWSRTTKTDLRSRWGEGETITGRLTSPGGAPIGGAVLDLVATAQYAGAKPVSLTSPRTGQDGRFELRLPRGESSRILRLSYRADTGDSKPVAERTLRLAVKAGVMLKIAPRVTSVGRKIFFKGVLKGGPLPPGGKQLVLEARSSRGEWIEFDVIRSGARGRYHASYRFKFPGPARYQFRVLCKHEADFPFLEGASNVVVVRER